MQQSWSTRYHYFKYSIVLQTVLYEFIFWITVFADEREKVQRKTFTKWINSHLQRVGARVNDMYHDLQDGKKLILLLEILSGEKLVRAYTHTNI